MKTNASPCLRGTERRFGAFVWGYFFILLRARTGWIEKYIPGTFTFLSYMGTQWDDIANRVSIREFSCHVLSGLSTRAHVNMCARALKESVHLQSCSDVSLCVLQIYELNLAVLS